MPRRGTPSPAQLAEARDRAREFLTHHESALIDELMNSDDLRLKLELWKLLKSYGDGPPMQRLEISTRKSPEQILEELAMRRQSIDSSVVEPAQLTEAPPPLPSRAPVHGQTAPTAPPEPPAPTAESSSQRSPVVAPPEAVPAPPPTEFEAWLASDEGRRASPRLREINRRILSAPSLVDRIAAEPIRLPDEDDW
jgi:hypothetical protein